jgi:hypothetical protein
MIEIDGYAGLAPRTFKSDPSAYLQRLYNLCAASERRVGNLYLLMSQSAYEHTASYFEHRDPVGSYWALRNAVLCTTDRVPVMWTPEMSNEVRLFLAEPDGAALVGRIVNISL